MWPKEGPLTHGKGVNYAQDVIRAFTGDNRAFFVDLGGDAKNSSPNHKTVGYVADQNTLAKYYSAADMLLYPSIADNCPLAKLIVPRNRKYETIFRKQNKGWFYRRKNG